MKHLKRLLALGLALLTLFAFAACKKKGQVPALEQAKAYISQGNYQAAYDLLYGLQNPTEAEKKLANRETDKPLASMIPSGYRDQKAVKIAIARLHDGRYILHGKE